MGLRDEDICPVPHTVNGSEHLTADDVRAYLEAAGYGGEAGDLMAEAARFPCTYHCTADRHRYVCKQMPGGYWLTGDCTEVEERIKALGAARKGRF